jgi:hypothetical protein
VDQGLFARSKIAEPEQGAGLQKLGELAAVVFLVCGDAVHDQKFAVLLDEPFQGSKARVAKARSPPENGFDEAPESGGNFVQETDRALAPEESVVPIGAIIPKILQVVHQLQQDAVEIEKLAFLRAQSTAYEIAVNEDG